MSALRRVVRATCASCALAAGLAAPAAAQSTRAVRGTVTDAATGAPVAGAAVDVGGRRSYTDEIGRFEVAATPADTLLVRRLGYRPARVAAAEPELRVALAAVTLPLPAVRVQASGRAETARLAATLGATDARAAGAATVADVVGRLPFVSARGAQGAAVVSMRGSRAEQTVVTLDGLPLNDPATGAADLGDLPLAVVGAATAVPGADAVRLGSGAVGGRVALASSDRPLAAARVGSYGERLLEAAGTGDAAGAHVRVGAAWSEARNDFPFVNREAATGADSVERRVNNDQRRAAVFGSAAWPSVQAMVLATRLERGLVGPMNVRAYDADRGLTHRVLARLGAQAGRWSGAVGGRALTQRYDDPRTPENATRADVLAADAELARAAGGLAIRLGAGADRLRVRSRSPVAPRVRGRAFVAAARPWRAGRWQAEAGVRADAYGDAGVRPSLSLAVERQGRATVFARAAQAFRAPTLYDLYLGAPRRLAARDLRPERVTLDAELGARLRAGPALLEGSAFHRTTVDAIVWFPGNFDWSPANVGRERVLGAEARAQLEGRAASASAWAGWYHARLHAGGLVMPTPYAPYAAAGATATAHRGPLSATASLRATGRRPFAAAPRSRATELPGVLLGSAHVSARLPGAAGAARLSAGVENLADVRWESIERFPSAGRTWSVGMILTPR